MVACVVVLGIIITSGHFEYASTTTMNILPLIGPAKSMCIQQQGPSGWTGVNFGSFLMSWHPLYAQVTLLLQCLCQWLATTRGTGPGLSSLPLPCGPHAVHLQCLIGV